MRVTPQVISVLRGAARASAAGELQKKAGLKDRVHFLKAYLEPLLAAQWIERTIPDKPRSRMQKYRLTDKGRAVLKKIEEE